MTCSFDFSPRLHHRGTVFGFYRESKNVIYYYLNIYLLKSRVTERERDREIGREGGKRESERKRERERLHLLFYYPYSYYPYTGIKGINLTCYASIWITYVNFSKTSREHVVYFQAPPRRPKTKKKSITPNFLVQNDPPLLSEWRWSLQILKEDGCSGPCKV